MTEQNFISGSVILFGSGETSASGQKIFDQLLRQYAPGRKLALLETPAGFELNSAQVIQRVVDFLELRLRNYRPQPVVIPARQRGTAFSPDDPQIVAPLLDADLLFMGPGSPTYAARQLRDSLAWQYLTARHFLGADLICASAAVIAVGTQALPVYEIYKVGEELHWKPGLDLFAAYGLNLSFVPHWNNNDGGEGVDTSRCFMGKTRFAALLALLPPDQTVVGIDEHTALWLDCAAGECQVLGLGGVTLLRQGAEEFILSGERFPLEYLGHCSQPQPGWNLPPEVWETAVERHLAGSQPLPDQPPAAVLALAEQRQAARSARDWPAADRLRAEIIALGWTVKDTPNGPELSRG